MCSAGILLLHVKRQLHALEERPCHGLPAPRDFSPLPDDELDDLVRRMRCADIKLGVFRPLLMFFPGPGVAGAGPVPAVRAVPDRAQGGDLGARPAALAPRRCVTWHVCRAMTWPDPVRRIGQYQTAWAQIRAPGERAHGPLRAEVCVTARCCCVTHPGAPAHAREGGAREAAARGRRAQPSPAADTWQVARNDYVVPTAKKRMELRWAVREHLNHMH